MCTDKEQLSRYIKWTIRFRAVSIAHCHMLKNNAPVDCFWKDTKIKCGGDYHVHVLPR